MIGNSRMLITAVANMRNKMKPIQWELLGSMNTVTEG